jgi:predicted NUDIX family NTP pyrophosphohydrolase
MPATISAGLLLYRVQATGPEVLLVHPGGPFFRNKDDGAWSLPKGLPAPDEALADAARREFGEELGVPAPPGELLGLGEVKQKGGKVVHGFALAGDLPADFVLASNTFELEWPPRSGRRQSFPEVDRAAFFPLPAARTKILAAQAEFLDRLERTLGVRGTS